MTFVNEADYDLIEMGDDLLIENAINQLKTGNEIILKNKTKNIEIKVNVAFSERQIEMILAGGLLNYTKSQN